MSLPRDYVADGGRWKRVEIPGGEIHYEPLDTVALKLEKQRSGPSTTSNKNNDLGDEKGAKPKSNATGRDAVFKRLWHPWERTDNLVARLKRSPHKESMLLLDSLFNAWSETLVEPTIGMQGPGSHRILFMTKEGFEEFCLKYRTEIGGSTNEDFNFFRQRLWKTMDYQKSGRISRDTFTTVLLALDPTVVQDNTLGLDEKPLAPSVDPFDDLLPFDIDGPTMNRLRWVFRFFNASKTGYFTRDDLCDLLTVIWKCHLASRTPIKSPVVFQGTKSSPEDHSIQIERMTRSISDSPCPAVTPTAFGMRLSSPGSLTSGLGQVRTLAYLDQDRMDYLKIMAGDHHIEPMMGTNNPRNANQPRPAFTRSSILERMTQLSAVQPDQFLMSPPSRDRDDMMKAKGPDFIQTRIHGADVYGSVGDDELRIPSPVEGAELLQSSELFHSDPESQYDESSSYQGMPKGHDNGPFPVLRSWLGLPGLISPAMHSASILSYQETQNEILCQSDQTHPFSTLESDSGSDGLEDLASAIDQFSQSVTPMRISTDIHGTAPMDSGMPLPASCLLSSVHLDPPTLSSEPFGRMKRTREDPGWPSPLSSIPLDDLSIPSLSDLIGDPNRMLEEIDEGSGINSTTHESFSFCSEASTPREQLYRDKKFNCMSRPIRRLFRRGGRHSAMPPDFLFVTPTAHSNANHDNGNHDSDENKNKKKKGLYHPQVQACAAGLMKTFCGTFGFNAFCQCIAMEWISIDRVFRSKESIVAKEFSDRRKNTSKSHRRYEPASMATSQPSPSAPRFQSPTLLRDQCGPILTPSQSSKNRPPLLPGHHVYYPDNRDGPEDLDDGPRPGGVGLEEIIYLTPPEDASKTRLDKQGFASPKRHSTLRPRGPSTSIPVRIIEETYASSHHQSPPSITTAAVTDARHTVKVYPSASGHSPSPQLIDHAYSRVARRIGSPEMISLKNEDHSQIENGMERLTSRWDRVAPKASGVSSQFSLEFTPRGQCPACDVSQCTTFRSHLDHDYSCVCLCHEPSANPHDHHPTTTMTLQSFPINHNPSPVRMQPPTTSQDGEDVQLQQWRRCDCSEHPSATNNPQTCSCGPPQGGNNVYKMIPTSERPCHPYFRRSDGNVVLEHELRIPPLNPNDTNSRITFHEIERHAASIARPVTPSVTAPADSPPSPTLVIATTDLFNLEDRASPSSCHLYFTPSRDDEVSHGALPPPTPSTLLRPDLPWRPSPSPLRVTVVAEIPINQNPLSPTKQKFDRMKEEPHPRGNNGPVSLHIRSENQAIGTSENNRMMVGNAMSCSSEPTSPFDSWVEETIERLYAVPDDVPSSPVSLGANIEVSFEAENDSTNNDYQQTPLPSPSVRIALVEAPSNIEPLCPLCHHAPDSGGASLKTLMQGEALRHYRCPPSLPMTRHPSSDLHHFASSMHIIGNFLCFIYEAMTMGSHFDRMIHQIVINPCMDVLELNVNAIRECEGRTIVFAPRDSQVVEWYPSSTNTIWNTLIEAGLYEDGLEGGNPSIRPPSQWRASVFVIQGPKDDDISCRCDAISNATIASLVLLALKALSPDKIHVLRCASLFEGVVSHLLRGLADLPSNTQAVADNKNCMRVMSLWTRLPCATFIPLTNEHGPPGVVVFPQKPTWESAPLEREIDLSRVLFDGIDSGAIAASLESFLEGPESDNYGHLTRRDPSRWGLRVRSLLPGHKNRVKEAKNDRPICYEFKPR